MLALFSPADVRAMDRRAIAGGVPGERLMDVAAGHLARGTVALAGWTYGLSVGVLCGKGGNGGDGLAAARKLLAAGAAPRCHVVVPEHQLDEDAARELRRYRAAGGRLAATPEEALREADVAVDCLLGTGATGQVRSPYREAVEGLLGARARRAGAHRPLLVVACDVPTGVDADTGEVADPAVEADLTVTFGAHKRGLWLWPARGRAGRLVLGDLGLVQAEDEPVAQVLEGADVAALVPPPPPDAEKRTTGVIVVLAGSPGMAGAAMLVARGALAAGAGLVTVATAAEARRAVAAAVPEALSVDVDLDDPDAAFEAVASRCERAGCLVIGPGLGHEPPRTALVRRLVREVDVALVLDADGINAFRHEGDALGDRRAAFLALTPHRRELERLLGPAARTAWDDRARGLPERAARWRATVVAKGPASFIAAPDGRAWINPTGSSALATGGTGDVLAGTTATLVAQRPEPASVAAAVWLHGRAGEVAAARWTARGTTALRVADAIPDALASLEGGV